MDESGVEHLLGIKPEASEIELGRGADGIVVELHDHPELVLKTMVHPFRLGQNRVRLEWDILGRVIEATHGEGATAIFNSGTDDSQSSWLVRERVFDVWPRGSQESRNKLVDLILRLYPNADINRLMLVDPTFDNVRWGYTRTRPEPRWILIDP